MVSFLIVSGLIYDAAWHRAIAAFSAFRIITNSVYKASIRSARSASWFAIAWSYSFLISLIVRSRRCLKVFVVFGIVFVSGKKGCYLLCL